MLKKQMAKSIQPMQAFSILLALLVCSLLVAQVWAHPTVGLSINKIEGYNLGSDINGQFTVDAKVSSDVVRVEFYLNGTLQQTDTSSPFSWTFNTNNYPLGQANITAVAYDSTGQQATAVLSQNFVKTPTWSIILPILVAVFSVIGVISYVWYVRRNSKSKLVKCPNCGYVYTPASISLVHIGPSKLRKCPKCGKMFFGENLEKTSKEEETPPASDTLTEDERLRRDIDESKYENDT